MQALKIMTNDLIRRDYAARRGRCGRRNAVCVQLILFVLVAFVYAVRALSLADAYSIFLSAPLIVTALSVPLLG